MTRCTRPNSDTTVDRVPWFSYTTRFYQNQTVSTTELSHSINGWANSMCPSTTTFCGLPVRCQFKKTRWSIPQITLLLSSLFPARVSVLDATPAITWVPWAKMRGPKSSFTIRDHFTCRSWNLVSCISCCRCPLYIGVTGRNLRTRFSEHLGSVYVTTLLAFLWPNISTPWPTVFLMSRCLVWLYAVELTHNESSVR